MSCAAIYLGLPSPAASSNPPESVTGSHIALRLVLLRMGFTCARPVTGTAVVSYTAFPPLPALAGGLFLLHFPWSRLRRTLSGILPCEARTFLAWPLSVLPAAAACPARNHHYIMFPRRKSIACRRELFSEAAAPDKFPENGIDRHRLRRHPKEIIQKLQQSSGLGIFRNIFRHLEQHRLRVQLQHSEFIDQSGIEQRVRLILKGENIFFLPPAARRAT